MPIKRASLRHPTLRWAELRRTSTFRLMLALGAVFLVAVALLLGVTYRLTQRELINRSDLILASETARLGRAAADERADRVQAAIAASTSGLNYFVLIDAQGREIAGNLHWQGPPPAETMKEWPAGSLAPVPLLTMTSRLPGGQSLIVARDITPAVEFRARILALSLTTGAVVVLSAVVAAVALGLGPLRRIGQLRADAKRIAAGEFSHRMPVSPRRDELDLVATTMNGMVEEIERLMEQVKGATDAIAHDLRSPLARLRMRLAMIAPRPEGVDQAVEDIDALLARFDALLRIAELEAANRRAGFGPLDPMMLMTSAAELYEPLAEEREIEIALSGSYGHQIIGDEALLVEAVGNLLDNAIKFAPHGGRIRLSLIRRGEELAIELADNGPGIARSERDAVLRRFYRGAASRQTPGSGLGLNLVAAIVHLHGFGLELDDAAPGLIVRIRAPELRSGGV